MCTGCELAEAWEFPQEGLGCETDDEVEVDEEDLVELAVKDGGKNWSRTDMRGAKHGVKTLDVEEIGEGMFVIVRAVRDPADTSQFTIDGIDIPVWLYKVCLTIMSMIHYRISISL